MGPAGARREPRAVCHTSRSPYTIWEIPRPRDDVRDDLRERRGQSPAHQPRARPIRCDRRCVHTGGVLFSADLRLADGCRRPRAPTHVRSAPMAAITSISNETPSRLTLINIDDEQMVLAPLQEKVVSANSGFDFDDLERNGIVRTRTEAPSSLSENLS